MVIVSLVSLVGSLSRQTCNNCSLCVDTLLNQGDYYWIEPQTKHDVPIGARVLSVEGKRIQVLDDDGNVSISVTFIVVS